MRARLNRWICVCIRPRQKQNSGPSFRQCVSCMRHALPSPKPKAANKALPPLGFCIRLLRCSVGGVDFVLSAILFPVSQEGRDCGSSNIDPAHCTALHCTWVSRSSVLYPLLSGSPAISYTTPDSCHSRLLRLVLSSESWSSLVMVRLRSVPLGASGNKLQTSNECLSPRLSLNSKTYLEYTVHHYTVGRHASMCGVRASLCIISLISVPNCQCTRNNEPCSGSKRS